MDEWAIAGVGGGGDSVTTPLTPRRRTTSKLTIHVASSDKQPIVGLLIVPKECLPIDLQSILLHHI